MAYNDPSTKSQGLSEGMSFNVNWDWYTLRLQKRRENTVLVVQCFGQGDQRHTGDVDNYAGSGCTPDSIKFKCVLDTV